MTASKRIAVIGAGGMAREVKLILKDLNRVSHQYDFVGYIVSDTSKLTPRDSSDEVVGNFAWLSEHASDVDCIAIAVANPKIRLRLASEALACAPQASFPSLVHPSVLMDFDSAKIGDGAILCMGVVATVNVTVGPFGICNFGVTIGHEASIGAASVINPGANISGGVTIGREVLVGTGAQILQYLSVGDGATVGAGGVVTCNVEPGSTVIGMPAKPKSS